MLNVTNIFNVHIVQNGTANSYIISLIIILATIVFGKIFVFITEKIILSLTVKTKTRLDDLIIEKTKGPAYLLLIFLGFRVALYPLVIPNILMDIIIHFIFSVVIILSFLIVSRSFNIIVDEWGKTFAKKTKAVIDDSLLSLFHKFINAFFIILAFIFILQEWGVQIGPFLASLGIAGIAIGFAVKDSLANIFGGIQLIIDKTFKVDDVIKVGNDIFGKVTDIGIRSTRILTWDNELLIIPNGYLSNAVIQNYAQPDLSARVVVDFGVAYGTDVRKVKTIVEEMISKMEGVLKDPAPSVIFALMADSSLNFTLRFWVESYTERLNMKVEATNRIYELLNKHKIEIPFPQRTVHIIKEK